MADRLAHEIGNALVPLATHQQLLAEKYKDKEFRESLDQALADGLMDAAVLTRYETAVRPESLRWSEWVKGQLDKVTCALEELERRSGSDRSTASSGCSRTRVCAIWQAKQTGNAVSSTWCSESART